MCPSNTLCADLTQADTAELSCLDKIGDITDCVLNGYLRVDSRALVKVEKFLAIEQTQAFIDAPLDVLFAAIELHLPGQYTALNGNDNFLGIFGVLGKVLAE